MMPDSLVRRHVTEALARHASAAAVIRAVAAELGPREGRPWLAMADALACGDVAAGTAAAARDPACWIPLFSTPASDPRLLGRIVGAAGMPAAVVDRGWTALVYPLALATLAIALPLGLSVATAPIVEDLYTDYGMKLPAVTKWMLGITGFMRSVWKPLVLWAGLMIAGWAFARWSIRRGSAVAAAFTRHLARLVEAGVPQDEALELSARAVDVPPVNTARPRRPLTHAAVAALAYDPPVAGGLLDAVAECHALRVAGASGAAATLFRNVAFGSVVLSVAFYVFAVFLPLLRLINDLS